jgi:hypothetical protein
MQLRTNNISIDILTESKVSGILIEAHYNIILINDKTSLTLILHFHQNNPSVTANTIFSLNIKLKDLDVSIFTKAENRRIDRFGQGFEFHFHRRSHKYFLVGQMHGFRQEIVYKLLFHISYAVIQLLLGCCIPVYYLAQIVALCG